MNFQDVERSRLELDREPSRITSGIGRTGFSTDGRETGGQGDLGSLFEHVGETEILETVGTLKDTVSTGTTGWHR